MNSIVGAGSSLRLFALSTLLAASQVGAATLKQGPMIIEGVTVHQDKIVFATAGDLWQVARDGGTAKAITKGSHQDSLPLFSPDGQKVAFLRQNKGNADVYSLNLADGLTTRHTNHPASDWPVAWDSQSGQISFASNRLNRFATSLFKIGLTDVMPSQLPSNLGEDIDYNNSGKGAFVPISHNPKLTEFRHYRGGQRGQIHIVDTHWQTESIIKRDNANVHSPKWLGDTLYYLSDENGVANIHRYSNNQSQALTEYTRYGVKDFDADEQGLVWLQDGVIHTMSLASQEQQLLPLKVPTSDRLKKNRRIDASPDRSQLSLSPDGSQFIMVARGDVFLANGNTGKSENLTKTAGAAERHGAMSPDGKKMAYFSDSSGHYQLHIQSLEDKSQVESYAIEANPGFYLQLDWSPDGKKLTFNDHRLRLWVFDTNNAAFKVIAQSMFSGQNRFYRSWSPDSNLLSYGLIDKFGLSRIYVYDASADQSTPLSPKDSYANFPIFDENGRYLYYFSSPNANSTGYRWAVLNGMKQSPLRRGSLKAVTLKAGDEPPVMAGLNMPNLNVEFGKSEGPVTIDYQGIEQRTITLDIGNHNIAAMNLAQSGKLQLLTENWPSPVRIGSRPEYHLYQLDLRNPGKLNQLLKDFQSLGFSGNGKWAYYTMGNRTFLQDLTKPKSLGKPLNNIPLYKSLEPMAEWQQMFDETFNFMVEQMYDPNLHGADPQRLYQEFSRYLPNITSRQQLRKLTQKMIGFLSVSHSGSGTGDNGPGQSGKENIGLLGADFTIENNRYRFAKIYRTTQAANAPFAPLDQYGAKVSEGDYLIAVNNQQVRANRNVYRYFFGTAERILQVTVADNPEGNNPRKLQIKTISNEEALRLANWAQANKDYVEDQSKGKLKYVHISGFNQQGIENFLAQYYQLADSQGLIVDIRYNPGGITSDALIELLKRKTLYQYRFRQGADLSTPVNGFDGETTLIINQFNGSAAETFAQMFKAAKVGTVVGKPTFGAGIGPYAFGLNLVDGARVAVPNRGSYMPNGKWTIENRGVHPDVDVDPELYSLNPAQDPQLNMAIEQNLLQLKNRKPQQWVEPQFPVHPGTSKAL